MAELQSRLDPGLKFHFLLLSLFEQGEQHFGCDSAQIPKFSNSAHIKLDTLLKAAELRAPLMALTGAPLDSFPDKKTHTTAK